jgi:hypothetical protein
LQRVHLTEQVFASRIKTGKGRDRAAHQRDSSQTLSTQYGLIVQ